MHKYFKWSFGILIFLLVSEISLRLFVGLGDPILYIEDDTFEYIYAPNQNVNRLGRNIITNEYSMRSLPVLENDSIQILKIGDSIINGGSLTDHDSLSSTLLENKLSAEFNSRIRVLNIGAGSWGPDNAFAYVKKYGSFKAKLIILVFSSHDLYDNMQHEKVVDSDPSYPSKKPLLALIEVCARYIYPFVKSINSSDKERKIEIAKENANIPIMASMINSGWINFLQYTKKNRIKLLVVLHPTVKEVNMKSYDLKGQKIISMLDSAKIDRILELDNLPNESLYRDDIHYNDKGQKFLAAELFPYLERYITDTYKTQN